MKRVDEPIELVWCESSYPIELLHATASALGVVSDLGSGLELELHCEGRTNISLKFWRSYVGLPCTACQSRV